MTGSGGTFGDRGLPPGGRAGGTGTTLALLAALGLVLPAFSCRAGEADPPGAAPERAAEGAPTDDGRSAAEGAAPAEEGAAGEETSLGERTIRALVDKAREAKPLGSQERLERAAGTASRIFRPLPYPFAAGAVVVGFVLMLFGRRLFRAGIVLYFMGVLGMVGREVGLRYGDFAAPLAGGLTGCVVGAGVALPLRVLVRALVGGLTGGILASIVVQSLTSDLVVTLVAVCAGLLASGVLTFFFPKPLMVIGFSLFGAVMASVGVLSVVTDPVVVDGQRHLAVGVPHVAGVVLAAALGVLFQSQLEGKEDEDG